MHLCSCSLQGPFLTGSGHQYCHVGTHVNGRLLSTMKKQVMVVQSLIPAPKANLKMDELCQHLTLKSCAFPGGSFQFSDD
jgi:hypothetical protein